MVTIKSTRGTEFGGIDAKDEDCVQKAGIDQVFAEMSEMAPQFLALQSALVRGMARSQEREAERLARRKAPDAEVAQARLRADQIREVQVQLEGIGDAAARVTRALAEGALFHGYVLDAEGAGAPGHVVQITGGPAAGGKRAAGYRAKTDESGYFRIAFDVPEPGRGTRDLAESLIASRTRAAGTASSSDEKAQMADDASASAADVRVDILDPSGKIVLRDPTPPDFSTDQAVFRFYPLLGAAMRSTDRKATQARASTAT